MKAIMGEYGKIAVVMILMMIMIVFSFTSDPGGALSILSVVKPAETVKADDSSVILTAITARKNPTLMIQIPKLCHGKNYDLTDKSMMGITAVNADGEPLPVMVEKILSDTNENILEHVDIHAFIPERGIYRIAYKTRETYRSAEKSTMVMVCAVVD